MNAIFKSKARLVFSLALAYAFMGWVGLALAIPPGYASPVFPAAGLALAFVLWFGTTALAGVWLGSALLNLSHPWWGGMLTPSTAVIAMVIATGATLQAYVGSWLVRRRQDLEWRTLEREQDVFVFLLLGGALAGVISSFIGVTALQTFGVIQRAEFLFNIWNWYVGDVLGVLVFAPLTLCLLNWEGNLWRDRRQRIVIPMLVTLGLVALAFYGLARWERQAQDIQLQADSKIVFERIRDRVIVHREVLSSLKRFIETTPDFSFEQFEFFTRITLQDNPDIFALSFNDLISDEKRPAFESMMSRLSPLGPFQITERDASQKLIRAMKRPEYVAVRYIVPLANNQPAVGYDIYSEPVRRDAINRARASGVMAVTASIRLVQEQLQRAGILELLPVISAPANEPGGRLLGFAVGVVKVDEMIDIAIKGRVPAGLFFQLIDPYAPDGRMLYQSGSPADTHIRPAQAADWKTTLRMGDRDWELSVHATEDYRRQHHPWMAWAVGVVGLMFATLLQTLMLGMTGRTSIIQRKNEAIQASEERYRSLVETTSDWIWEVDVESRYVYASDKVREILGYAPKEIIGRTPFDLMPAPDARRLESQFREIAARRLPFRALEKTNVHKNGGTVILETSGVPIFGSNGEFRGYRGMDRDITKRKQAEKALRESEERYRTILDQAGDAIFIHDEAGRFLEVNRKACQNLGYSREELLSKYVKDIDPNAIRMGIEMSWNAILTGARQTFESRQVRKDGSAMPVEVTLGSVRLPKKSVILALVRDISERKRTQAAIKESQERLALALRGADLGTWDWNVQTGAVSFNDRWAQMLGYELKEIEPNVRSWDKLLHSDDRPRVMEVLTAHLEGRTAGFETEHRLRHKSGSWVWVLDKGKVIERDAAGKPLRAAGTHLDITERKRAEEALRETEERFSVFMSHLPASAFIKDADGRMVFANRYLLDLFGIRDYAGKTTPEIVAGEVALQMTEDDRRALTEGVINVQETIRDSHGKERTFEVLKFPIHTAGEPVRLGGLAIDITALKQIEAALRESEGKYRALIEATSTGFLELDDRGRVLDANAEYVRQTGHSALDEIKLRSVVEWTAAEDRERNVREVQKCLQNGRVSALEIHYVDANGHVTPVEINATTLPTGAGLRILTFSHDITARKRAEAERERLITELEMRNAELERFTYTVSHDLKSPLITVQGLLGYLEKDALVGNTERMKADVERIKQATNKMDRLLLELLQLSRVGRTMNPPQAVALEEIVREALEVVAGQVKERGVCVEVASGLPVVWGDKLRLVEVVQNLLDNAVKFMGEQPKPVIEVGVRGAENGKAIVFVRDNGMGIDPRYQERVFGLFDKLDAQTEGTGIGLALVKRIIETHGGRIWVESEGKGSTFCFTVPVQRNGSVPGGGQESPM